MTEIFEDSKQFACEFPEERSLAKFFLVALSGHAGVVLASVLGAFLLDLGWFQSEPKDAKMVQSAVRVDVVGMPKLTVKELKNMEPDSLSAGQKEPEAPKAAAAPSKSEIEFKKTETKKVELSSLLGALSSKKVEKAKKRKKKGSSLSQRELNSLMMEGNKVSKGQALVGDSLKEQQGIFLDYVSSLPGHIKPYWRLPSYLLEKELKARIRIYVSENGKVLKASIYESSGVKEFDQRALEAVEKAGSLPAPDKKILSRLTRGDVILGFPL
ncbi:MAG: energy transducer TonB, partial [Bacteriovoracaceae bacterium]